MQWLAACARSLREFKRVPETAPGRLLVGWSLPTAVTGFRPWLFSSELCRAWRLWLRLCEPCAAAAGANTSAAFAALAARPPGSSLGFRLGLARRVARSSGERVPLLAQELLGRKICTALLKSRLSLCRRLAGRRPKVSRRRLRRSGTGSRRQLHPPKLRDSTRPPLQVLASMRSGRWPGALSSLA